MAVPVLIQQGEAPAGGGFGLEPADALVEIGVGASHGMGFVEQSILRGALTASGRWCAALAGERAKGAAIALEAATANGTAFAMVDTSRELGHMLELYERARLAPFYALVREAARGWDGREPVRKLG